MLELNEGDADQLHVANAPGASDESDGGEVEEARPICGKVDSTNEVHKWCRGVRVAHDGVACH